MGDGLVGNLDGIASQGLSRELMMVIGYTYSTAPQPMYTIGTLPSSCWGTNLTRLAELAIAICARPSLRCLMRISTQYF